jgi:hypothetical protein
LDPGAKDSWNNFGQTFVDISGNGYNFSLGTTTGVAADDPAFYGSVGMESSNEYFQYDGGDFFLATNANDTLINSLHKVGATYSCVGFVYPLSTGRCGIFHTGGSVTSIGIHFYGSNTGALFSYTGNGSANSMDTTTALLNFNQVNMAAVSVSLDSTTSRTRNFYLNGVYQSTTVTSSFSFSSSAASSARIGASGDSSIISASGSRLLGLAVFDRTLVAADFDSLRASALRRWPTI